MTPQYDYARDLARRCGDRTSDAPLAWREWTPPQDAWLRLNPPSGVKALRGGNQAIGKTEVLLAEVIYRATGTHPWYPTKAPPVDIWVVCTSWSQSVAIQMKFWDLAPKAELTQKTRERFSIEDGWGRGNPVATFENGSIVRFRTTGQGAKAQAGASPDYIAIDEPTTETMFRELRKRVLRTGGQLGWAFTPVNFPCEWIRDQVRDHMIDEVHVRLTPANLIPIGSHVPLETTDHHTRRLVPMDQKWIDELRRTTPAMWAPVVIDGEWDAAPQGVFFRCFDEAKHATGATLAPSRGDVHWCLGFDYAAADREYGFTAVLSQVQVTHDDAGRIQEWVAVQDEVALPGYVTTADFAEATVAMLRANGVGWRQLRHVYGDNPVQSRFALKSNIEMMKRIAKLQGVSMDALTPRILSAKEGGPSARAFNVGCQFLYDRIATGHLVVNPRCKTLIKGLSTWDFTKDHELKDVIDALRYSLKTYVFASPNSPARMLRVA